MRRKRSNRAVIGNPPGDHDGILDVLVSLVGVLTLVGAISAVVAANAAVKIKTQMSRTTNKDFVLVVVADEWIWNLQPAKDAIFESQKYRINQMRSCLSYDLFALNSYFDREMYRIYADEVGAARYLLSDEEIYLQRISRPDIQINSDTSEERMHKLIQSA